MPCQKHPFAVEAGRFCPACLLEEALGARPDADEGLTPARRLTVLIRLGQSESASVYLVRQEEPAAGLLRLKVWRRRASDGFLDRFAVLRNQLQAAAEPAIATALAASVDGQGMPSVLSEFRQGFPILDAVQSGSLTHVAGIALVDQLGRVLDRLHAGKLAHGSLAPGNVFVRPDLASLFLVDCGSAFLLDATAPADLLRSDREGLATLAVTSRSRS